MKVLVTGASGFVAKHVVRYLSSHGHEPVPTDVAGGPNAGSVTDRSFVLEELGRIDFEAVVHLAGIADLNRTIENPYAAFEINSYGTLNVLELALRKNVKRFVYACYDERTRVFTTAGIKRYNELHTGDLVFTLNPSNGLIEVKPIERVYVYRHLGKMIHFDGRRIDLLVTPNHKMLVKVPTRLGGRIVWATVFEDAEMVASRSVCRLASGRWIGPDKLPAIFHNELQSLTDLYYLTGLFVGDGDLNGTQYQIIKSGLSKAEFMERRDSLGRFTTQPVNPVSKAFEYPRTFLYIPEQDKCRHHLEELLQRNSLQWSGYKKSVYVNSDFLYGFFQQCYDTNSGSHSAHTKRIPRWMLNSDPKLLHSLLQGLLDSDGSRGRMLTTVSLGLVEDTMELCSKLGYFTTCSLSHSVSQIAGRTIESTGFRLNISAESGTPMFGKTYNNVHSEDYDGNVFCIEVENHNFLVERNGKIAFSGNSSANVYGVPSTNPVSEQAAFNPRVPYDYSKVAGESFVMGYHRAKGLPVAITRSWLLFGEYDAPTRAVPRFVRSCLRNEPIRLFNSGRDTTAPSHAENYGRLVADLIAKDSAIGQAFNFGGEKAVTIRELAELIRRLTGSTSELQMLPPRSASESEPQVSYPSTEKMKRLLGYEYELGLETGLRRTVEWVRSSSSA